MPFNITRSGQFLDKEVLKYSMGDEPKKSGVLNALFFPLPANRDDRKIVPKGTILTLCLTPSGSNQYVEYSGSGRIEGILARGVEIMANATAGAEPAAFYFHNAIFATSAIVNFTNYASALISSLPTCKFE